MNRDQTHRCLFTARGAAATAVLSALCAAAAAQEAVRIMVLQAQEQETVINGARVVRQVTTLTELGDINVQTWRTWIFRTQDPDVACEQLHAALRKRIEFVSNCVPLTDEQRQKLELAGQGDISRFLADCEGAFRQIPPADRSPRALRSIQDVCQALRRRLTAGLHEEGSLFCKSIQTVLDSEQQAELARLDKQRREPARVPGQAEPRFMILQENRLQQLP